MRRIGPLIAEARATIEAQAAHIQKQSLEYISLFDQCSEAQDRVKALEVKCALLSQSLEQEKTRSAALEAGLTDGVTDDMAVLQSRVEELEAQLRERGEPVAWRFKTRSSNERWRYEEFEPTHISDYVFEKYPLYYHPPAAAANEDKRDAERYRGWRDAVLASPLTFSSLIARALPADSTSGGSRVPSSDEWDAAIDAGIAAQKEQGK
jgi:hypothetical protein